MTAARVPWWGLVSSGAAPVLLIGGWSVAAARQPAAFDSRVDSISALAARGATDRWIMTAALTGVGLCHVATAMSLRPGAALGRWTLAAGGAATVLVALLPLPADGSGSAPHAVAAGVSFLALAIWPAAVSPRGPASGAVAGPSMRPAVAVPAAAALLALVGWFGAELAMDRGRVGLSERVAAGAQSLWPLATVAVAMTAAAATRRKGGGR